MLETQPEDPVPEAGDGMTETPGDPAGGQRDEMADTPGDGDSLTVALDHLAENAERTSAEQQLIADSARAMTEEHRRGRSWAAILAGEGQPSVLALLGTSLRRLSQTSSRVRAAVAAALVKEGLSTRQIAAHLGVTHQRISAMLNRHKS
jgi:Homeodomain-like domain